MTGGEKAPGIIALVGLVLVLGVLGLERVQDAEEAAANANAKVVRLKDQLAGEQDLKDAIVRLTREVTRLRMLVLSLGGDPGVVVQPSGNGGGNPSVGKDGNGGPKPPPEPPPQPEPSPSDEVCVRVGDVERCEDLPLDSIGRRRSSWT